MTLYGIDRFVPVWQSDLVCGADAGGVCRRELNEETAFYSVSVSCDSARHRKNTDRGRHRGGRWAAA